MILLEILSIEIIELIERKRLQARFKGRRSFAFQLRSHLLKSIFVQF